MKTQATAKFVGTSARKMGLVAALIRGKKATVAQTVLAHTDKRATDPIGKVLNSAIANATNNYNAKLAELTVEQVLIGPGPTLKRFRPRAKGAASSIKKRSSHITVILSDQGIAASVQGTDAKNPELDAQRSTLSTAKSKATVKPKKEAK